MSNERINRKDKDRDIKLIIRDAMRCMGNQESINIHKVMAHTRDHADIEERKRRIAIMQKLPSRTTKQTIISSSQETTEQTTWPSWRATVMKKPLRVPLTLHEDERFCISTTADGKKIFINVREYIRADLREKWF